MSVLCEGRFVTTAAVLALTIAALLSPARADDRDLCLGATGDENIAACNRAIDGGVWRGRDLAVLHLGRAHAYDARLDIQSALADINRAIRLDPNLAPAYDARGRAFRFNPDRAIVDFNEAIRLDPRLARAYADRGAAYRLSGDADRALTDLNEAIRLDPTNAYAYCVRGLVDRDKGELDRAIEDDSTAIRLAPSDHYAYFDRGQLYQAKGDLDRAIADNDQTIRLGAFTHAYEVRGGAYQAKGDLARAVADYDEAIRRNPDDAGAFQARGLAKLAQGDSLGGNADLAAAKRLTTIVGLPIPVFTALHIILGLLVILSGAAVLLAMSTSRRLPIWTALFFSAAFLTDAGGLLFRLAPLTQAYPLGLASLGVLAVAALAFYVRRPARHWRWVYVIATTTVIYLNVIVAISQSLPRLPVLARLLPLDPAPVFAMEPVVVTALFLCIGIVALRKYHPNLAANRSMAS